MHKTDKRHSAVTLHHYSSKLCL